MKQDSSTVSWNQMGTEWFKLAQKEGESRLCFIMPYMLGLMGEVIGKEILDLGCGEGGYARELAKRGARVTAVDCAEASIAYAREQALAGGLEIAHHVRNSNDLYGIENQSFDLVLCSMMLMDCEDLEGTLREVERVLRSQGKCFVSILHPCFNGEHTEGIGRQGAGLEREVVVKNYFSPSQWEAPLPQGTISVIWRHRTLSEYMMAFLARGFTLAGFYEPQPTPEQAAVSVPIAWLGKIPLFLFMEWRKG